MTYPPPNTDSAQPYYGPPPQAGPLDSHSVARDRACADAVRLKPGGEMRDRGQNANAFDRLPEERLQRVDTATDNNNPQVFHLAVERFPTGQVRPLEARHGVLTPKKAAQ